MAIIGRLVKRGILFGNIVSTRKKLNPLKLQKKALTQLVNRARFTEFGEKYMFEEVLSSALFEDGAKFYDKFKANVPVYDYNKMYNDWWHLAVQGQKNVSWPGRIKFFALSSGTSEAATKQIPVSKAMSKAIQRTSIRLIFSLGKYKSLPPDLYEKGFLMLGGSTNLYSNSSSCDGDLSGIAAKQIPFWFRPYYKPGQRIAAERDWTQKLEEITKEAKAWDIGFIVGVPAWLQLLMERIIEYYKVDNIHEIWPNLKVFAHGGVSFEPYKKSFSKLLGKPLIYIETYLASEGFLAYQSRPEAPGMQLVLNNGIFFEFIPFNDENFDSDGTMVPNPKTLMIHEVENGKEYALLISTCAGAWRYLIGDTVKIVNKENAEIVITGRTKHFLSLCGEHLSVDNMNRAIDLVSDELGITVKEFTVAGVPEGSLFAHHWYIGTEDKVEADMLKESIDRKLKELNDDYAIERRHALKRIDVTLIPNSAFYGWLEAKGKLGGQNKFPRVLRKTLINEWQEYLERNNFSGS